MTEDLRRLVQNLTLTVAIILFALRGLGYLSSVVSGLKELNFVVENWNFFIDTASHHALSMARISFGLEYSPITALLAPVVIQLFLVMLIAFWRFGASPYWVRGYASLGSKITIHYPVHFVLCMLLLVIIVPPEMVSGFVSAPTSIAGHEFSIHWYILDMFVVTIAILLVILLLGWHPGVGMLTLSAMIGLLLITYTFRVASGLLFFQAT